MKSSSIRIGSRFYSGESRKGQGFSNFFVLQPHLKKVFYATPWWVA